MASPATDHHKGRRHFGQAALGLAAVVCWLQLDDVARHHMFLINRSPSLPNWAFVIERGATPQRGSVSFFAPPRNALVRAHFGDAPAPFGKYTYGMPGDLVERRGDQVFIKPAGSTNSVEVGRLKPVTRSGEPLAPGPTGIIPKDCYYMGSPHKDGFDSRYAAIGFVCSRQLVGTATTVLL